MTVKFVKAVKHEANLRLALAGPAGSGKTYTMLALLTALAQGKPVAVLDTEHGSASKYSDLFGFDVLELDSFHPQNYIDAIHAAEQAGYACLGIDSMSHAWMGKDGALELVDRAAARSQSKNSYMAWRDVTPIQTAFIDAIVASRLHIVATLRTKTEYVLETVNGKQSPRKIGLAPVQRDQVEYEFDVYGEMTSDNDLIIGKTRCPALAGKVFQKPGANVAAILHEWLKGAPPAQMAAKPPTNGQAEDAFYAAKPPMQNAPPASPGRGVYDPTVNGRGGAEIVAEAPAVMIGEDIPDDQAAEVAALFDTSSTAQRLLDVPMVTMSLGESPLRQECRALHAKVIAVHDYRSVTLPVDDAPEAKWSQFLDVWSVKLAQHEDGVARRGQTAQKAQR